MYLCVCSVLFRKKKSVPEKARFIKVWREHAKTKMYLSTVKGIFFQKCLSDYCFFQKVDKCPVMRQCKKCVFPGNWTDGHCLCLSNCWLPLAQFLISRAGFPFSAMWFWFHPQLNHKLDLNQTKTGSLEFPKKEKSIFCFVLHHLKSWLGTKDLLVFFFRGQCISASDRYLLGKG